MILPVLCLIAYFGWIARLAKREYDRLAAAEAAAEQVRLMEVRAFASHLGRVCPDGVGRTAADLLGSSIGVRASARIVERLLDLFDDSTRRGVVIGRTAPTVVGAAGRWPTVASRHAARGHAPERTISADRFPLVLPDSLRDRHLYGVGKSNSGKTTLIRNLVLQDAARGAGIGVLGPEAELFTEELLPFLPEHRLDDVIYLNPADAERPVPLNPLVVEEGEDFDRKVDETLTIFHRLVAESGVSAPRMETILRYTLNTLMSIPGTTLLDIPRLLDKADGAYREWAISRIASEEVRHFWTSTYALYPKDAHLSLLNRLAQLLQPRVVRNVLCQPNRCLNMRKAMDSGKIVLFNLSDGILGEQNALLLGQLVVAKIQMAAMSRADIPKASRRPFHLFIDEFQSFTGVAGTSYEKILSRARKYRLCLTLVHQQTGQVPEPVMREILGNVATHVIFQVGATDARRLARELEGADHGFDHRRLTALPVGVAYCLVGGRLYETETLPPPRGGSERIRDEAIRCSRERYGSAPGGPSSMSSFDHLEPGDVF